MVFSNSISLLLIGATKKGVLSNKISSDHVLLSFLMKTEKLSICVFVAYFAHDTKNVKHHSLVRIWYLALLYPFSNFESKYFTQWKIIGYLNPAVHDDYIDASRVGKWVMRILKMILLIFIGVCPFKLQENCVKYRSTYKYVTLKMKSNQILPFILTSHFWEKWLNI